VTEECRVYRAVVDGRQSNEESLVELAENGGGKVSHGSGGIVPLPAE
jgi:hypothetical protein